MKQLLSKYVIHNVWFCVFSFTAIGLLVASFVVPPTGIIDPSVLAAVGEIFGFAALGAVLKAIDKGVDAKVTKGNTTLTVGDLNKPENTEEDKMLLND